MRVGGVPLDTYMQALEFLLIGTIEAMADRDPEVVADLVQRANA